MFKLAIKDLRANNKTILFRIVIPMLLGGNLFTYPYLGWFSYFSLACLVTIISGSVYFIWDKKKNVDILSCSLPVSRFDIVNSRYLVSLMISVAGLVIWGLNAYISDLIWSESATRFSDLFNLKILFMSFIIISIHFTIFLPAVFAFRRSGVIFSVIYSIVISYVLTIIIFKPEKSAFSPSLDVAETFFYISLFLVVIVLLWLSLLLSRYIFARKDIE